ncbi:MAG: helix-turn-helix transcriptional regulator [Thermomicrobiales bacterium]|nr:helix-turn-helix transcriptional regulator [Thermomicrobiales bacterium]
MSYPPRYTGKGGLRGKYKENWISDPLRNTIIEALNQRNMNIADLSRAIGAPGSSVISRWMMGGRPSVESLEAIAEALDLDVFDLLHKAGYTKRMPSNGLTADPGKMRLMQRVADLDLTPEREAALHAMLDVMETTPIR